MLFGTDNAVHLMLLAATFANVASATIPIIEQTPDCVVPPAQCDLKFHPSTPRAKRRCRKPGILLTPTDEADAPRAACIAQSYSECQVVCTSSKAFVGAPCHSFGFDSESGMCTTSTQDPQQQGFVRDALSTTTYTAGRCFTATYLFAYPSAPPNYVFRFGAEGQRVVVTNAVMQEEEMPMHVTDQCAVLRSCIEMVDARPGYNANGGAVVVAYDKSIAAYRCTGYQPADGRNNLATSVVEDSDYVVSFYYQAGFQE